MKKRILVTGASGFIGRHCVPGLLAGGFEVHTATSKEPPAILPGDVNWHRADLLDAEHVTSLLSEVQPTHLLHLAWVTTPSQYWVTSENIRWVEASLALFREFVRWQGERLVVAGSCAEYDWRYGYCTEDLTPTAPAQLYGTCKHALHLMTESWVRELGVSMAWARVFFLYGPHEQRGRLVPSVITSLLAGELAHCSHGSQIRDYLHVADAAQAFVALITGEIQGTVNIASGNPISIREMTSIIGKTLDSADRLRFGTRPISEGDPPLLVADIQRLVNETGWRPAFDLESGLLQTIEWWKQQTPINPQPHP
ncbi:MAG: NAD(P)-dependent oxidoreductase [Caldilineaceae bacterium]